MSVWFDECRAQAELREGAVDRAVLCRYPKYRKKLLPPTLHANLAAMAWSVSSFAVG